MKKFELPEIEVEHVMLSDVITTSNPTGAPNPDQLPMG